MSLSNYFANNSAKNNNTVTPATNNSKVDNSVQAEAELKVTPLSHEELFNYYIDKAEVLDKEELREHGKLLILSISRAQLSLYNKTGATTYRGFQGYFTRSNKEGFETPMLVHSNGYGIEKQGGEICLAQYENAGIFMPELANRKLNWRIDIPVSFLAKLVKPYTAKAGRSSSSLTNNQSRMLQKKSWEVMCELINNSKYIQFQFLVDIRDMIDRFKENSKNEGIDLRLMLRDILHAELITGGEKLVREIETSGDRIAFNGKKVETSEAKKISPLESKGFLDLMKKLHEDKRLREQEEETVIESAIEESKEKTVVESTVEKPLEETVVEQSSPVEEEMSFEDLFNSIDEETLDTTVYTESTVTTTVITTTVSTSEDDDDDDDDEFDLDNL
jgi:hypothetical protein